MTMRNSSRFITLLVAIVLLFCLVWLHRARTSRQEPGAGGFITSGGARAGAKVERVMSLIDNMYIDPVQWDTISERVLIEMMAQLDPHSTYIPASDMGEANESLEGEFDGIGVVFNMLTDTVVVLTVIPSGPSYKAGVQAGDRILTIDSDTVAGKKINQNDVVKRLRGKRGTKVQLGVERTGSAGLVPITVTRGVIPIKSVTACFMLTPEIGFIRLAQFSRNSHTELFTALRRLEKEGMKNLIFDLRDNTGGFLDQAILIANEFLKSGEMIVYTENRAGQRDEQFADGSGLVTTLPLAMLIDEQSAASSEILAGAIQDNDRGTIVGRRSFGKGLVQQQIPFRDGSAIRLTIARYYTPTGRSIQKPYVNGHEQDYYRDLLDRYNHHEYFSADSIKLADSLKFTTPGGKTVYGGGGIMPDIFVPLDTTGMTAYYVAVAGKNILYRYTLDYSDRHRKEVNKIETTAQLDALLAKEPRLLEDFMAYAARNGVEAPGELDQATKELIVTQLRAYIGRNTPLEDSGFYYEITPVDNTVKAAIASFGR